MISRIFWFFNVRTKRFLDLQQLLEALTPHCLHDTFASNENASTNVTNRMYNQGAVRRPSQNDVVRDDVVRDDVKATPRGEAAHRLHFVFLHHG